MNHATVQFHLDNIVKNRSQDGHISDLKKEIGILRAIAYKYKGSGLAHVAEKRANQIDKDLNKAILDSKKK